jgi:hypothetical protein
MALVTNVHVRVHNTCSQIAPLPDDAKVQRLRELSMDYIREAERFEKEGIATRESSEQISAALDAIARDFFARTLRGPGEEAAASTGYERKDWYD